MKIISLKLTIYFLINKDYFIDFYNICEDIYEIVLSISQNQILKSYSFFTFQNMLQDKIILPKVIFKIVYQTPKLDFSFSNLFLDLPKAILNKSLAFTVINKFEIKK